MGTLDWQDGTASERPLGPTVVTGGQLGGEGEAAKCAGCRAGSALDVSAPTTTLSLKPTIDVTHTHALPIQEARTKAEAIVKQLAAKYNLNWRWVGNVIRVDAPSGAAKGTKGEITVSDKTVRVAIDLPLLARMAAGGAVERTVRDLLDAF
jgi:putative polyhydroxyalkanoate system protein